MTLSRRGMDRFHPFPFFGLLITLFLALTGMMAIMQGSAQSGSTTRNGRGAAPALWSKAQVVAARHQAHFPAPQVFARELQSLAPEYKVTVGAAPRALDRVHLGKGQQAVSVLQTTADQASLLLVASNEEDPVRITGAVGEIYPAIKDALPRHFSLRLFAEIELGILLLCLLAAFAFERGCARDEYNRIRNRKQRWQEKVPESLYGPLEPTFGFEVWVAVSKDDFDAGVIRFTTERQRWQSVRGYMPDWDVVDAEEGEAVADKREETVPLEAGVEEIATRWVAYCTRVAHENALAWARQQEAEPLERAEREVKAEQQREQIAISAHLPSPADVMRAFPLDRELWPELEPVHVATANS